MTRTTSLYRLFAITITLTLLLNLYPPILWAATPEKTKTTAHESLDSSSETIGPVAPLTISRVQSTYQAGSTVVVTVTVRNNLLPTTVPTLTASATVTESLQTLSKLDFADDANTIRDVIVVDSVTTDATRTDSSPSADSSGDTFVLDMGDIAPLSSATAILTLDVPSSVSDFTDLDTGAEAFGFVGGEVVSAETAPALLVPSSFGEWLISTPDANLSDQYMLNAVATTDGTAEGLFAYVRDLDYEVYDGSLRGTRGTVWSEAGNSTDQASLLIAMLRSQGIPARYRHGSLDTTEAQQLISAIFPTPTRTLGYVLDELPTADPVNDPDLLTLVSDHWWVEAYVDGAWTDLDPSFADAEIGDSFASSTATDGTDQIAELPDDTRHKVTMSLKMEEYHPLNPGDGGFEYSYPLAHTFNSVALVGEPVTLAHLVTDETQGGWIYANLEYTYTPYFQLGDETFSDGTYQELFTNFPLGTVFFTGAWWQFDLEAPDGTTTRVERELVDRIGAAARLTGGALDIALGIEEGPIIDEQLLFQVNVAPSFVPNAVLSERVDAVVPANQAFAETMVAFRDADESDTTAYNEALHDATVQYRAWAIEMLAAIATMHYAQSDYATDFLANAALVKAYPAAPRLIIAAQTIVDDETQVTLDLIHNEVTTHIYPDQAVGSDVGFHGLRGVADARLEGEALGILAGETPITTATIFDAAYADPDTGFTIITPNTVEQLDELPFSAEATARIQIGLSEGKTVTVPDQMVTIGDTTTIAWYETDPDTGRVVSVMENGLHGASIQYAVMADFGAKVGGMVGGFSSQYAAGLLGFVNNLLTLVNSGETVDLKQLLDDMYIHAMIEIAAFVISQSGAISDSDIAGLVLGAGKTIEQNCLVNKCNDTGSVVANLYKDIFQLMGEKFTTLTYATFIAAGEALGKIAAALTLDYYAGIDPPLAGVQFSIDLPLASTHIATATVPVTASSSGTTIAGDVVVNGVHLDEDTAALGMYAPAVAGMAVGGDDFGVANFDADASVNATDATLQLSSATGTFNATAIDNSIAVANFTGTLSVTETTTDTDTITVTGDGDWFTLELSADSSTSDPNTAIAFDAIVTSNFDGDFVLTVTAPDEWSAEIDATGAISITPRLGATPNDYVVSVVTEHDGQAVTTAHIVTITAFDGVEVTINPDPILTVPFGSAENGALPSDPNNGQVQVTDAAFTIDITNTSTSDRTFDVTLTGLPAGWGVLNGETDDDTTITLPAGEQGQIGLYVEPDTLPAAGTSYPFTIDVVAQDDAAVNASDADTFTMPALAYPHLTFADYKGVIGVGESTDFAVTLSNIGNSDATFPLTSTITALDSPTETVTVSPQTTDLAVNAGMSENATITIDASDATVGERFVLNAQTKAGAYNPADSMMLTVVSAESACIFTASTELSDPLLVALLEQLGADVNTFAQDLTDLDQRDAVVATLADLNAVLPNLPVRESLLSVEVNLVVHVDSADFATDLNDLCTALDTLSDQIIAADNHSAAVAWTPPIGAILLGDSTTYTLSVTNQGALSTTYDMTVTLPTGVTNFSVTLDPDETHSVAYPLTPAGSGYNLLEAVAVATDAAPVLVQSSATAGLNVVDQFVQVTAVAATPSFVETGTSTTTLSLTAHNIAGVPLDSSADVTITAPNTSVIATLNVPLTVKTGGTQSYDLGTVDTSAWVQGVYTISATLEDSTQYGYLSVGEGIIASAQVTPELVGLGTVTVTNTISTEITPSVYVDLGDDGRSYESSFVWSPTGIRAVEVERQTDFVLMDGEIEAVPPRTINSQQSTENNEQPVSDLQSPISNSPISARTAMASTPISRTESAESTITYSGSWSNRTSDFASDGTMERSSSTGDTAVFTFDGTWLGVGLVGGTFSGDANITIDGTDVGTYDLYRHDSTPIAFYFDDLVDTTHTVTVTVLGTSNDFSSGTRVNVDYFDTWDGTTYADTTVEEDDSRVWIGDNWTTRSDSAASSGQYIRTLSGVAWFPFTGDSVTYQAIAYANGGDVIVTIDGEYQTTLDLFSRAATTRTLSFDGLGSGAHVLQIHSYRDHATVDTFTTPGSAPFYTPPTPTGIIRHEETDPAIRYNGAPLTQTAQSWVDIAHDPASGGYQLRSATADDVVSMEFEGTWVGVGLVGGDNAGEAEIFIDGVSQEVVDLYRTEDRPINLYYDNLISGTHTISVTVLGTSNAFSSGDRVKFDFFETWDGTAMADGTFEADVENTDRLILSENWTHRDDATASDGSYIRQQFPVNAWLAFTGESAEIEMIAYSNGGTTQLYLDGEYQTTIDLYNATVTTRTIAFGDLDAGPHIVMLSQERGMATLDTISTPADAPYFTPEVATGVVRYEENDPALRYNGATHATRPDSWDTFSKDHASHGYTSRSSTLSDTVTLTFDGTWVSIGLVADPAGGMADVQIDGVSQGIVDTYASSAENLTLFYTDLSTDTHTIEVIVLDTANASASNTRIFLDYIDVWDGTAMNTGWYESDRTYQANNRVDMTANWTPESDSGARGDEYYEDGETMWFRFTGDSVTVRAFSDDVANTSASVTIDGVSYGTLDLQYDYTDSPLPFHFDGLGDGGHVLALHNINRAAVDAFEAVPMMLDTGVPLVEWAETATTGQILNTAVAGDLDGDGTVEIVATDDDGTLAVYRGDGADAGDGTPILWSVELGGEPDTPALADLDGADGTEIVVGAPDGLYAYHADGTLFWFTDTVKSTWRAVSIGNVDADDNPEIVTSGDNCPCVVEHDGTLAWSGGLTYPLVPNLVDLTGDGRLDILTGDHDTLYLYETSGATPALAWSLTFSDTIDGRGAPAVADVTGDGDPEIAIVSNGAINLVNADGTLLWSYATGVGAPGGVSIADIDGDGDPEIVASAQVNGGTLYALEGDGSFIWSAPALDGTSANSVSLLDLDGDGAWEAVWNGFGQGLTIYNGADGSVLFNEPLVNSQTRIDYPIIADVDGDDSAEIVTGDNDGLYVIGWDSVWTTARPLWNQYNYAITNINDDLTVPPLEPPSWSTHNTYRTQTNDAIVLPIYSVALTHTVPLTDVAVLSDTFTLPTNGDNPYEWSYEQAAYETTFANSFSVMLSDVQPNEVRQVSDGTEIVYTLPSGSNQLSLPPQFVTAASIIVLDPPTQTVAIGSEVTLNVTLSNPTDSAETYTLGVAGVASEWVTLVEAVDMSAQANQMVELTLRIPVDAVSGELELWVSAETGTGGLDRAHATLTIADALAITIAPAFNTVNMGASVPYTATLINHLPTTQTVALSGNPSVDLPATVELPASSSVDVPMTVTGASEGLTLFDITATTSDSVDYTASALLDVVNGYGVAIALDSDTLIGGVGTPVIYTVTVTNTGSFADVYDLTVSVPSGWSAEFVANDETITELALSSAVLNSAEIQLAVTAPIGTIAGSYPISVTATSQANSAVAATDSGDATISDAGVTLTIASARATTLAPDESGLWDVTVTNIGGSTETFDLSVIGYFGAVATFSADSVTLDADASQTIQVTTEAMPFALPMTQLLTVRAVAESNEAISAETSEPVTFSELVAVNVGWLEDEQTIPLPAPITYLLVVSNTGNIEAEYTLSGTFGTLSNTITPLSIDMPAHSRAVVRVTVEADTSGTFAFTVGASDATVADDAPATLIVEGVPTAVTLHSMPSTSTPAFTFLLPLLLLALATILTTRPRRQ